MPPHLHPRSRTTSSLFATTLLASFLVVGLPHVLPCPRPATRRLDAGESKLQREQQRERENYQGQGEEICVVDENGRPVRLRRMRRRRKTGDDGGVGGDGSEGVGKGRGSYEDWKDVAVGVRTKSSGDDAGTGTSTQAKIVVQFQAEKEMEHPPAHTQTRRECPIPKPGGIIGEVLGLKKAESSQSSTTEMKPRADVRREPPSDTG